MLESNKDGQKLDAMKIVIGVSFNFFYQFDVHFLIDGSQRA